MEEIDRQLEMGMDAIAEEDKWMLDVDVDQLKTSPVSDQQYWVHAMEAARKAGHRALEVSEGATNSWSEVCQDDVDGQIPTTTSLPMDVDGSSRPLSPPDVKPLQNKRETSNSKASGKPLPRKRGCVKHDRLGRLMGQQKGSRGMPRGEQRRRKGRRGEEWTD